MKILVNKPDNTQELLIVGEGGDYSDKSKIEWHEGVDGTCPDFPTSNLGGMVRSGNTLIFDQARKDLHDAAIAVIDAEEARLDGLETEIKTDTVINQLKAMDNAEFNAWWAANVTNAAQAIGVMKRLAKVIIRRVL